MFLLEALGFALARKKKYDPIARNVKQNKEGHNDGPLFALTSFFLLYFHKIVRLATTDLSISLFSMLLCLLFPPTSILVSNLNNSWPVIAILKNRLERKPKANVTNPFGIPRKLHVNILISTFVKKIGHLRIISYVRKITE